MICIDYAIKQILLWLKWTLVCKLSLNLETYKNLMRNHILRISLVWDSYNWATFLWESWKVYLWSHVKLLRSMRLLNQKSFHISPNVNLISLKLSTYLEGHRKVAPRWLCKLPQGLQGLLLQKRNIGQAVYHSLWGDLRMACGSSVRLNA